MSESIVIVGAARTPMGAFQGDFSSLAAHDLGGAAIKAAVERAGIPSDAVGEVLLGNCLMAGQGQAPARQAALRCPERSTGSVECGRRRPHDRERPLLVGGGLFHRARARHAQWYGGPPCP